MKEQDARSGETGRKYGVEEAGEERQVILCVGVGGR